MGYSFDGPNKRITLTIGTTTLNVKDMWSRWVDWFLTSDNSKYDIWMMQIGGDDIDESQGTAIPVFIFLASDVKIKPQEADHTLSVTDAILVVAGGGDPFVDTDGEYTVRINYQQPVQAIVISGESGTGITEQDKLDIAQFVNETIPLDDIADAVLDESVEGSLTLRQHLRISQAVLSGISQGGGTPNILFKSLDKTKNRIVAIVDGNGNRSNIVLDVS